MTVQVIFISGPTAIGKSELALKLAQKFNCSIINADSMQVYKELKILTARPTIKDQKSVVHHLYGHVSGAKRYNVSKWCNETISILKKNNENNKISIIVGGTAMYIETLLNGIVDIPDFSEEYKKASADLLTKIGIEKFYLNVFEIDKKACSKISNKDSQRLKRIWEVYQATGKTLSEWVSSNQKKFIENTNYLFYLFIPNRKKTYEKVNNRFIKMIDNGAIEEVKELLSMNLDNSLPIMKAHGVPEIAQYLIGNIKLNECILKSQQITRNYVKRQISWWKSSKLENIRLYEEFPSLIDLESLKD